MINKDDLKLFCSSSLGKNHENDTEQYIDFEPGSTRGKFKIDLGVSRIDVFKGKSYMSGGKEYSLEELKLIRDALTMYIEKITE